MNASSFASSMLVMAIVSASAARVVLGPGEVVPPLGGERVAVAGLDHAEALLDALELALAALGLAGVGRGRRAERGDGEQGSKPTLSELGHGTHCWAAGRL